MKIHFLTVLVVLEAVVWIKVLAGLVPSKGCEGKGLFQACGWSLPGLRLASSPCLFTSSPLYVCLCVQTSPLYEDTSPTAVELTLVTSLYLVIKIKGGFFV